MSSIGLNDFIGRNFDIHDISDKDECLHYLTELKNELDGVEKITDIQKHFITKNLADLTAKWNRSSVFSLVKKTIPFSRTNQISSLSALILLKINSIKEKPNYKDQDWFELHDEYKDYAARAKNSEDLGESIYIIFYNSSNRMLGSQSKHDRPNLGHVFLHINGAKARILKELEVIKLKDKHPSIDLTKSIFADSPGPAMNIISKKLKQPSEEELRAKANPTHHFNTPRPHVPFERPHNFYYQQNNNFNNNNNNNNNYQQQLPPLSFEEQTFRDFKRDKVLPPVPPYIVANSEANSENAKNLLERFQTLNRLQKLYMDGAQIPTAPDILNGTHKHTAPEPEILSETKKHTAHEILNVPEEASKQEIKAAYKKILRDTHPDKVSDEYSDLAAWVNAAYHSIK